MHGKSCGDVLTMLGEIGVSEDQYPLRARYGVYLGRRNFSMRLTPDELARIPEKHRPTGRVIRSRVVDLELAPLIRRADREDMIFQSNGTSTPLTNRADAE